MNNIRGGTSVEMATARPTSWFERYSWTAFVFLSGILVLFGVSDLPGATSSLARENALNELFIGCLSGAVAILGLRRGQRSAWYAMALWPVWIGAQTLRAASGGNTGELVTGLFLLIVAGAALALSYRAVATNAAQRGRALKAGEARS
jgi:hypothetical protein